jgi:hypothetical protein
MKQQTIDEGFCISNLLDEFYIRWIDFHQYIFGLGFYKSLNT